MTDVIYLRTSTDDQNPKNQLDACKSMFKKGQEYSVFEDKQSAWREHNERWGFNKIVGMIKRREVKNLYVWDLDRIYRNRRFLVDFFKLCEMYKCIIHSYRQKWLSDINEMPNPWNEVIHDLMLQIMGWIAQEESDKKSQRVKAAIRLKEDGAYSYKGNKWGRKMISTVKRNKLFKLRQDGLSMGQIANELKLSKSVVHKYLTNFKGGNNG